MKALQYFLIFTFLFFFKESIGQESGCLDQLACNYNPNVYFDNGTCSDEPVWFIPCVPSDVLGNTPAVLTCGAPEDYVIAIQSCLIEVIESDAYCINFTWDSTCQDAYNECLVSVTGCMQETACNYNPFALIHSACINEPLWHIPQIPTAFNGSSPAILSCDPIDGYFLANQCFVSAIVVSDDYCINNTWDQTCQVAYDEYLTSGNVTGCADPEACNYVECVNLSDGSCNYEQWYIPNTLGSSPVVLSCTPLTGFSLANQCSIGNLISNDPFCVNDTYDFTCQTNYNFLLSNLGCPDPDACNYDSSAVCDEDQCDYTCLGCNDTEACNYNPSATHNEDYCDFFSCENEEEFFITKWQTLVQNDIITIRGDGGSGYNYFIDWGDGTFSNHVTGNYAHHNYETPGEHIISIRGLFPAVRFVDSGDEPRILEVVQWGNNVWESMSATFYYCHNIDVTATDTPDLSEVNSCSRMFYRCYNLSQGNFDWDMSSVTDTHDMFHHAHNFDQDISSWDVSNVTDMSGMLSFAETFNQNLNLWNVSNVNDMSDMFDHANDFNQNISSWNVSNVTDMSDMFDHANDFNQNISSWNVSNVTDMGGMFSDAEIFNQDIGSWNVSNVTNLSETFLGAKSFNQDISSWDVSNVTYATGAFRGALNFNQDISSWDISNITNMSSMFQDAQDFNQDISTWDVSNVYSTGNMFDGAEDFNQDLGSWDVSGVSNMRNMFANAHSFNQNLNSWDVSSVAYMGYMFSRAHIFNQNLSSWDVSNVTDMSGMFLNTVSFDQDLSSWDVSNVTDMSGMFLGTVNFNQDIGSWNVSNVSDMSWMFEDALSFNQDIGAWDVSSVIELIFMFSGAESFNQDLSSWDMSNITSLFWFLDNSGMSTENYDLLLESLANQAESIGPSRQFGAQGLNYCQSEEFRNILTSEPLNWLITDSGQLCVGCTGDIDSDGHVTTLDLSIFLAAFGTEGESPADLNGDGAVNVEDLGLFLGVFGSECI